MTLHIYLDDQLTQPLSEGDLSNPDSDTFNGTDGESKDRQLYLANEQTTLAVALDASATTIQLTAARFAGTEIIIINSEQMRVVSGGGTTALIVERGYGGTSAAPHPTTATIYSGYDYSEITIQPTDTTGTDESSWFRLANNQTLLAGAAPGVALNLGTKPHNTALTFWRRCSVPPSTAVQIKTDIRLRLNAMQSPIN